MATNVIERGNTVIIPLDVEVYDPVAETYKLTNAATVQLTVIDTVGNQVNYTLSTGVVNTSAGDYYVPITNPRVGHMRATWSTTSPDGQVSVGWQVVPVATD
jgi:hypothetical protein